MRIRFGGKRIKIYTPIQGESVKTLKKNDTFILARVLHIQDNEEAYMKILKICIVARFIILLLLTLLACEKVDVNKDIADEALAVIKSVRGTAAYLSHSDGGSARFRLMKVDSFYIDDTTCGVRSVGWLYWDDNNTPSDTTDDIATYIIQNIYLDWNFTENWYLKINIDKSDRETEMAVKNVNTTDSLYAHLGKVNRPGGVQSGPGIFTDGKVKIDITMGMHHAETPDDYDDNFSWLEFYLYGSPDVAEEQYWVHADFRPDNTGSGEIRVHDISGAMIATFEWDEFGRGTLVVDGKIYPFEW